MIKPLYKKIAKIVLTLLSVTFAAIQFFPDTLPRENPPVSGEPEWDSPETRATFFKICSDCHSNETRFPWYSAVAPVSWMIENDVKNGRKHFNVSEWDRRQQGGDKAADEVQRGAMPTGPYLLMHPRSNLNIDEKKRFVRGLMTTFGSKKMTE